MTYYEVLQIDSRASTAEVERAFRRMARKVHPDLNAGDETKAEAHMKLLNEIRDTLTDPLLRAGYDERLRLEALRQPSAPPRAATPRPAPQATNGGAPTRKAPLSYAPVETAEPRRSSHALWLGLFLAALGAGVLVVALLSSPRIAGHLPDPFESAAAASDAGFNADAPPLLTTPVSAHAASTDDDPATEARPPGRHARGRGVVVHIGSTADDVLRVLGQPDRYVPGRQPGESVLHYGTLRLEMKNGRVVGGDAAAR